MIIPFSKFVIQTELSPSEIQRAISNMTEPKRDAITYMTTFRDEHKPFEGEVAEDHFRIQRIIKYRSPFLPLIDGFVRSENHCSVVQIKMKLRFFVSAFLTLWLGLVGGLAVIAVFSKLIGGKPYIAPLISGIGMCGLVYTICVVDFSVNARRSYSLLKTALRV